MNRKTVRHFLSALIVIVVLCNILSLTSVIIYFRPEKNSSVIFSTNEQVMVQEVILMNDQINCTSWATVTDPKTATWDGKTHSDVDWSYFKIQKFGLLPVYEIREKDGSSVYGLLKNKEAVYVQNSNMGFYYRYRKGDIQYCTTRILTIPDVNT